MAIHNSRVTLGTVTASLIAQADVEPQYVWIHEADHSESTAAYLGAQGVTAANGFHLHSGQTIEMYINPGDSLYGISGQGTPTIHVLRITQH